MKSTSKNPTIYLSVKKIFSLLTFREKMVWLKIVGIALCTSILEVITASTIVVLAQVLNQPESGKVYFVKLGFGEGISSAQIVFYVALTCGLVYLVKNSVAAGEVFFQNFFVHKMNYNFKNKILNRFTEIEYSKYLMRTSAYGMSVLSDVNMTFVNGMLCLVNIVSETLVISLLVFMIVYINPSLAFFIFTVGVVIVVFLTKFLFPLFYSWGQRVQESSLLLNQNLMQFFHGFKEIILLGKRESFITAIKMHSRQLSKIQAVQTATNTLPRLVIEALFIMLFVTLISYLCFQNDTPQQMIGVMGGYLYAGFRLMPGLNRIISQLNVFKSTIPSIERVHKEYFSDSTQSPYEDIPELTFEQDISFRSVSFRYMNTKKDALNDVNWVIRKGECMGIVGETGSGKSTLVDLILGLLHQNSGQILIDEKYPVCSYQWHQKIGYVPQSVYLVDDTIEANIAFGENKESIDKQRLTKSINDAQLTSFINQLPDGTKTVVGERGVRLSGGERQRIAIARALYRSPEVLIFDEATSALDNETEEKLMKTIYAVSQNRTVIMIAHRLSTLKNCTRIIVMNDGKIHEEITDRAAINQYTGNTLQSEGQLLHVV